MRNIRRFVGASIAALIVLAAPAIAEHRLIYESKTPDAMPIHIYELGNGLRVYITENHDSPRFYAEIAVRAGSKNDPSDCTGLAHYLEHLLFKGTQKLGTLDYEKEKPSLDRITELYEQHFRETDPEKRKAIYAEINAESQKAAQYAIPNEMDRLYKGIGGALLNAHTSNEETVFEVSLPSNRLEQWAPIESERFADPVFRLFQPELEVVYEEKNRSMDNKDRIIGEAVNSTLYKVHPYGQQTTLGTIEHLKKPSLVHIRQFFDTYYVPNNMAICMSGDIDTESTIKTIDQYFSSWKPKKLPAPAKWREKPLKGVERVTVKYKGEPYAMLAFRTVAKSRKDADALELADMILSNSAAGLIDLNLNQQQKVRAAGASPEMLNDYGAEFLWGIPKEGQSLDDVSKLLVEQLDIVKRGEIADWVIPAIITDFKKTRKGGLESNVSRVSWMRDSFIAREPWEHADQKIARMEKLTKADVVRVARKYFGDDYVCGYRVDEQQEVPQIQKPGIDPIHIDPTRQSAFAKQILAMPVKEMQPVFVDPSKDYRVIERPGGVRLYYVKNPINDLFSLSISVEIGSRHDSRLGIAAQLLDKSGTARLSSADLKTEWYKLGTGFSFGPGDQETYVSIAGLDENFDKSLALMMDVLHEPKVDQETLNQLIAIILKQREDSHKDMASIGAALTQYARYGAESSYLKLVPSDALKKLTIDELQGLTKGLLDYRYTVMYTGSLPAEKVMAALDKALPNTALKDPPAHIFLKVQAPKQNTIYFFNKEAAQAQVRIEFPSEETTEKDFTASLLFNNYFGGGMAGVVFQEIRESRALAYSAGAAYMRGDRTGDQDLMIGAMGNQADKAPEALGAFIGILDKLPVSDGRFGNARESVLNDARASKLGFRQIIPNVRSWKRLGLEVDPRKRRFQEEQSVDMQGMLDFYQREITGRPKLISIVGDAKRIDTKKLAPFGELREVGVQDIFVR